MKHVRYLAQGMTHCTPSVNADSWCGNVVPSRGRHTNKQQTTFSNPLEIIASD